jgi:hypothetical protein
VAQTSGVNSHTPRIRLCGHCCRAAGRRSGASNHAGCASDRTPCEALQPRLAAASSDWPQSGQAGSEADDRWRFGRMCLVAARRSAGLLSLAHTTIARHNLAAELRRWRWALACGCVPPIYCRAGGPGRSPVANARAARSRWPAGRSARPSPPDATPLDWSNPKLSCLLPTLALLLAPLALLSVSEFRSSRLSRHGCCRYSSRRQQRSGRFNRV